MALFCKNCGVQLNEGDKFCPSCGTSADGSSSIDSKQLGDGLLRIKDAIICLFKNPFKGAAEAHQVLNPFASYLFAVLLSLAYGLTALWTKSAFKKTFSMGGTFGLTSFKTFELTFLTVLLCIAVIFGLLYLVSKVMLKQIQNPAALLNAAVFPFVVFLEICIVENIVIYISFKFYLVLAAISILFLVVYLYHNIALVISNNGENSPAAYTSALSFVCITIIFNKILFNNVAAGFTDSIKNAISNFM